MPNTGHLEGGADKDVRPGSPPEGETEWKTLHTERLILRLQLRENSTLELPYWLATKASEQCVAFNPARRECPLPLTQLPHYHLRIGTLSI